MRRGRVKDVDANLCEHKTQHSSKKGVSRRRFVGDLLWRRVGGCDGENPPPPPPPPYCNHRVKTAPPAQMVCGGSGVQDARTEADRIGTTMNLKNEAMSDRKA